MNPQMQQKQQMGLMQSMHGMNPQMQQQQQMGMMGMTPQMQQQMRAKLEAKRKKRRMLMQQVSINPVQMVLMMMITGANNTRYNGCIKFEKCK